MKLFPNCLTVVATLAVASLPALAQSVPATSKPVAATKPAPAAAAKPAAPAADEIHTVAVMTVDFGGQEHQIMFELLAAGAPKTVQNFVENVDKGTYSGLAFHRAVDDYLVQTGDPASRNKDARDSWGLSQEYTIPGEFKLPHVPGAVAMARRSDKVNPDRKSDGTQFYFVLGNMSHLDGQYTVFGQVYSGLDSLKKLSEVATDSNDCPLERVEIKGIKVIQQKGPLVSMKSDGKRRITKSEASMSPMEKLLYRFW